MEFAHHANGPRTLGRQGASVTARSFPAGAAATAVRPAGLVAGVLPYRDFSMVQPPGGMLLMVPAASACVVTNDAACTVAAGRFYSGVRDCPSLVDSFGTLFAMTSGRSSHAPPAVLRPVVNLWQSALQRAQYVWLTSGTSAQIPWTRPLDGYLREHFRLIGLAWLHWPRRYVPCPGLYVRR